MLSQKGNKDFSHTINCHILSLYNKNLKEFCIFTGKHGTCGILEDGAADLAKVLEEMIYGPPPPNFTPAFPLGFANNSVNGPSWITYPANALVYSLKNKIPLVNDNPLLPVPALGDFSPKSNAKILTMILAVECIKLILPSLPELNPLEIVGFREQTEQYVRPFRLSMLRLSKELNSAITSGMNIENIQKEAVFLVETTVYPELEELKRVISDPAKPWHSRIISFTKGFPEIITSFMTMPTEIALSKLLYKISSELLGLADEEFEKENKINRCGLTYLLKISELK